MKLNNKTMETCQFCNQEMKAITEIGTNHPTTYYNNSQSSYWASDFLTIKYSQEIPSIKINLKVLMEGMYYPLFNQMTRKDSLTTYLHQSTPPYNLIDSAKAIIDSISFSGLFKFFNAPTGTYYISVKHFNCIETWSKTGGENLVNDGTTYNL
jgi:hypothetical protein